MPILRNKNKEKKESGHKELGTKRGWSNSTPESRGVRDQMIGGPETEWSSNSDEVMDFKRILKSTKKRKARGESTDNSLAVYLTTDPLPDSFPENIPVKFELKLEKSAISFVSKFERGTPCNEILSSVVETLKSRYNVEKSPNELVLKCPYNGEFIGGSGRLCDVEFIRETLTKTKIVKVSLVEQEDARDFKCTYDRHSLYSFPEPDTPHHNSITIDSKKNVDLRETIPIFLDTSRVPESGVPDKLFAIIHFKHTETYLTDDKQSTTIPMPLNIKFGEFLDKHVADQCRKHNKEIDQDRVVLRVTGTSDFLFGNDHNMLDFEVIRSAVASGSAKLQLDIVRIDQVLDPGPVQQGQNSSMELGDDDGDNKEAAADKPTQSTSTTAPDDSSEEGKFSQFRQIRSSSSAEDAESMSILSSWDIRVPFGLKVCSLTLPSNSAELVNGCASPSPDASNSNNNNNNNNNNSNSNNNNNSNSSGSSGKSSKQNAQEPVEVLYFVRVGIFYGSQNLGRYLITDSEPVMSRGRDRERADFGSKKFFVHKDDPRVGDLPRESRLEVTAFATTDKEGLSDAEPIAYTNLHIFDHKGKMIDGKIHRKLRIGEPAPHDVNCVEETANDTFEVELHLPEYSKPVYLPQGTQIRYQPKVPMDLLHDIIKTDPLYKLADGDKFAVWSYRHVLKDNPEALPKVVQSVDWCNYTAVCELYRLLEEWAPIDGRDALQFLGVDYPDTRLREWAVRQLEKLGDKQVCLFMLQLVECLKFETYHMSPLACFLLRRAVLNPHQVGHSLYWALKSEMHNVQVRERYGLILQEYIKTARVHVQELMKENTVVDKLWEAAMEVKKVKRGDRTKTLQNFLKKVELPTEFSLPLSSKIQAKGLVVEKCKAMSSAKAPLWLVLENANEGCENMKVMFKAGDDLKQDGLTLQLLRIMDEIWKEEGLDLLIIPYGCVATDEGVGFIEIVDNATTMAQLTTEGSSLFSGATAAFKERTLATWLSRHNKSPKQWEAAVDRFVRSCAGYCVATYVMGIGDRHSDNIMIKKNGSLFHIDFGHFLGHFKMVAGMERETSPFVFTPMYGNVLKDRDNPEPDIMMSPHYKKLENLGGEAFNILRRNGSRLLSLLKLMQHTGIPELETERDIAYLRDKLELDMSDENALDLFKDLLAVSMGNKRQLVSDTVHNIVHYYL